MWFSDEYYHPIQAGSIDGTDEISHDHGIVRACSAKYIAEKDPKIVGDPYKTLFVGRLSWETTEETLLREFSKFGKIVMIRLVRDIVTGFSRGYAFITFESGNAFFRAFKDMNHFIIDGKQILVDFERERIVKGWIPRRYGGGVGGKKESGQIRFGGRDRPFKKPLLKPIPSTAFQRFDMYHNTDRFYGRQYTNEVLKKPSTMEGNDDQKHNLETHSSKSDAHEEHESESKRSIIHRHDQPDLQTRENNEDNHHHHRHHHHHHHHH